MPDAPAGGLEHEVRRIMALAEVPAAAPSVLALNLKAAYDAIRDFDLARFPLAEIRAAAPRCMTDIFETRARVRDRLAAWEHTGLINDVSLAALRDFFRISRYALDMLGETAIRHAKLGVHERPRRAFSGQNDNTFVAPAFATGDNLHFRSGDVLLMRGTAHNSAAIARIGDVDTLFSHLAIVYIDHEGRHWLVESLIEDGAVITPLEEALGKGAGRAVLYRCKDRDLAAGAAERIFARVHASATGKSPHIPYDFSMRLDGDKRLFCAKLIRLAFAEASGGRMALPRFPTRLGMKNRDFFRRLGVRARETFAPGDIDVDPRFDLVAEWQDYRVTSRMRTNDLVMDKLFAWMETDGYRFRETLLIRLIALFGRFASRLSKGVKELLSDVIPKVPAHMPRRTIATIAMLHKTGEEVMAPLLALEGDHIARTGLPLPPAQIPAEMERLRSASNGRVGYLSGPG